MSTSGQDRSEQDRSAASNALILRLCLSGMLEEDEEDGEASTGWMLGPAAFLMPCSAICEGGARGMGAGAESTVAVAGADEADGRLERAFLPGILGLGFSEGVAPAPFRPKPRTRDASWSTQRGCWMKRRQGTRQGGYESRSGGVPGQEGGGAGTGGEGACAHKYQHLVSLGVSPVDRFSFSLFSLPLPLPLPHLAMQQERLRETRI